LADSCYFSLVRLVGGQIKHRVTRDVDNAAVKRFDLQMRTPQVQRRAPQSCRLASSSC